MIRIARYSDDLKPRWDAFVAGARNATFLHLRDYMDYHRDRFDDCSLVAFNEKDNIVAVLPAEISGEMLRSHEGLTYGGWLTAERHFTPMTMLEVFEASMEWMRKRGIRELVYKAVPWIYARYPADDDVYALFRYGAEIENCQVSAAMPLDRPLLFNQSSRQGRRLLADGNLDIGVSDDLDGFWQMLNRRLRERYGTDPVHTLDEMRLLAGRFPDNIRLFMARRRDGMPLGGILVYYAGVVAHTQYIATNEDGRKLNVLPAVVAEIVENHCCGMRYFDFGVSCEDGGRRLNEGLAKQKDSLGGRSVAYTSYRLRLMD